MQADNRSRSVEFAKILKISTPLVMPGCRDHQELRQGSQEIPTCRARIARHAGAGVGKHAGRPRSGKPEEAHFTCVACGAVIEEHHRPRDAGRVRLARPQREGQALSSQLLDLVRLFLSAVLGPHRPRMAASQGRPGRRADLPQRYRGKAVLRRKGEAPPWETLRDRAAASTYRARRDPGRRAGDSPAASIARPTALNGSGWVWAATTAASWSTTASSPATSPDSARSRLDALLQQTWINSAATLIASTWPRSTATPGPRTSGAARSGIRARS